MQNTLDYLISSCFTSKEIYTFSSLGVLLSLNGMTFLLSVHGLLQRL